LQLDGKTDESHFAHIIAAVEKQKVKPGIVMRNAFAIR
jgi:hypothetical protein